MIGINLRYCFDAMQQDRRLHLALIGLLEFEAIVGQQRFFLVVLRRNKIPKMNIFMLKTQITIKELTKLSPRESLHGT
jgi:hypothetical protein